MKLMTTLFMVRLACRHFFLLVPILLDFSGYAADPQSPPRLQRLDLELANVVINRYHLVKTNAYFRDNRRHTYNLLFIFFPTSA